VLIKPTDIKAIVNTALLVASAAGTLFDILKGKRGAKDAKSPSDVLALSKRIDDIEENQLKSARILKDATDEIQQVSMQLKSYFRYIKIISAIAILNVVGVIILLIAKLLTG
jgi:hypothetical protein